MGIEPLFDSPPMPTSEAEWLAHWAFHRLTVRQRDAAWREIDKLHELLLRVGVMP